MSSNDNDSKLSIMEPKVHLDPPPIPYSTGTDSQGRKSPVQDTLLNSPNVEYPNPPSPTRTTLTLTPTPTYAAAGANGTSANTTNSLSAQQDGGGSRVKIASAPIRQ